MADTVPDCYLRPADVLDAAQYKWVYVNASDLICDEQKHLWLYRGAAFVDLPISRTVGIRQEGEKLLASFKWLDPDWTWTCEATPPSEHYVRIDRLIDLRVDK